MEDPQLYIRIVAVLSRWTKLKAPVLNFSGSADTNVPPAQKLVIFPRAASIYDKVPVKFVSLPGRAGTARAN